MQISKISFPIYTGIKNNFGKKPATVSFGLSEDRFEKILQPLSEDDKSAEEFIRWSQRNGFVSRPSVTGRLLGRGEEANIYTIDGTDNWVIKQYKRSEIVPAGITKPVVEPLPDISPKLNIGQAVAKVEIPLNRQFATNYFVLKKQVGFPVGLPVQMADNDAKDNQLRHARVLKVLAEAPQETYDKLIQDVAYINKQGLKIKAGNPSNILFDAEKQQFNFIDVNDKKQPNESGNQFGEVLYSILGGKYGVNYMDNHYLEPESDKVRNSTSKIVSKYFDAMKYNGEKFTTGKYFNRLIQSKLLEDNVFGMSFRQKTADLRHMRLMD